MARACAAADATSAAAKRYCWPMPKPIPIGIAAEAVDEEVARPHAVGKDQHRDQRRDGAGAEPRLAPEAGEDVAGRQGREHAGEHLDRVGQRGQRLVGGIGVADQHAHRHLANRRGLDQRLAGEQQPDVTVQPRRNDSTLPVRGRSRCPVRRAPSHLPACRGSARSRMTGVPQAAAAARTALAAEAAAANSSS